jgi:hypothetical protein
MSILQNYVDSEGYYNAEIKCESCSSLSDEINRYESWIWSANDYQKLQTIEVDEELHMHVRYGNYRCFPSTMIMLTCCR